MRQRGVGEAGAQPSLQLLQFVVGGDDGRQLGVVAMVENLIEFLVVVV